MLQPLLNPRNALWCCAVCLSQCESASPPPARVLPLPGCARVPGCAASRSSISAPCTAFFRLAGLAHRRLIPLKARILIEDDVGGITERLGIGNLLVRDLAGVGLTQVAYPRGLGLHDQH